VDIGKKTQELRVFAKGTAYHAFGLMIVVWMFLDFVPRFFQGDSLAYLATGEAGWIPPDRSWAFGYLANFLLRYTHGYSAFILMQIGILACLIASTRLFFSDVGRAGAIYGLTAVLLALDPLLEIYARFVMSDFLAVAAFFAAMLALFMILRERVAAKRLWLFVLLFIASTIAAVFIRIAYALVIELMVLLAGILTSRRLVRRQWLALAAAAFGPLIAVTILSTANGVIFGDRFQHQLFINRLSGVFLASLFAPALQMSDFEAVGVPITASEFLRLDLGNYDKRAGHPWGQSPDYLHQFIRDKLGVKADYTAEVNKVASGLVWNAFIRNPIAVAKVYAWSGIQYARPAGWHEALGVDLGISRALPASFVDFSNRYSILKIDPEITKVRSPLVRFYEVASYCYPLLLLLGLMAAGYLMTRRGHGDGVAVAVLVAGLLADLAAAPLYSYYVIARYVLGAIIISYILIGIAMHSVIIWLNRSRMDDGVIVESTS
jgi:hypothetical protein